MALMRTSPTARDFGTWPPGWPLPMWAVAPTVTWGEVVAAYLAFVEAEWRVATVPAEPVALAPAKLAA